MSYSITKQNDDITYNLVELVADTPADLASLPTTFAAGSTALIISTSETYILDNSKEWQLKESGGGGGGGSSEAIDINYDNTESGLEATNVQDAIDEMVEGIVFHEDGEATEITPESIAAEEVAYDNTESGLDATDVQAALDELAQGGGGGDSKMIKEIDFDGEWIFGRTELFPSSSYGNATIPINSLDIDDIDKVFNSTNTDFLKYLKKILDGFFALTPEYFELMKPAITSGWMQVIPASNDSLNWVLYNEDTFFASFFKYDVIKEYDFGSVGIAVEKIKECRLPITISIPEKDLTYDAILVLAGKAMSKEKEDIVFKQTLFTEIACFCDIGKGIISIDQEESICLNKEYQDFIIPGEAFTRNGLHASFNTPNVIAVPISSGGSVQGAVRYDESQSLSNSEKERARNNIGAAVDGVVPSGTVRYDISQYLTDAQKAKARSNIGAVSASDIPSGTVRYDASQSLTDAQKTQARNNIGTAGYRLDGDTLYID